MRREPIVLQERLDDPENENVTTYMRLLETGAEVVTAEQVEDATGGVETGRGIVRAVVSYSPAVAEAEDRINAAMFRGKQWSVVGVDTNVHASRTTLELAKA